MKLICNGQDLADACLKVYKAASVKSNVPILEGIKLSAFENKLLLVATDLEIAVEILINAEVSVEGEIVVPGKFFSEFVKKLTSQQIELTVLENNQMRIKYLGNESLVSCYSAAEYPVIKQLENAQSFTIIKHEIIDLLKKVVFSVSKDDSRPILRGVLLEVDDYSLTGVALDGYRLAKAVKPLEKTTAKMSAIVPARGVEQIIDLIDDNTTPVMVSIQKNYLNIDLTHTKITTRLLDGDFINYRQILPTQYNSTLTIPREELGDALERAGLLVKAEKNNLVRFDIKDNLLHLTSNSELGNVSEYIPIKINGIDMSIAFNAKYLLEIMRFIKTSHIILKLINSNSPAIITPSGLSDDSLYLVLPVRLL